MRYEDVYLAALCLYLIYFLLFRNAEWTERFIGIAQIAKGGTLGCVIMLWIGLLLLSDEIDWRIPLLFILSSIILFLSYRMNGQYDLFFTVGFCLLSYNVSAYKIIKTAFWGCLISILICISLCALNIVNDYKAVFYYGTGHSLGMTHPNMLAAAILSVIISWEIIYNKIALNIKSIVVFGLTAIIVWNITKSRTTTYLIVFFPVILLMVNLLQVLQSEKLLYLVRFALILLVVGSYFIMVNSKLQSVFSDGNLRYRFSSAYYLFRKYGIHPFGNSFEYISTRTAMTTGKSTTLLDSAYLYLLIYCGYMPLIVILCINIWIARRCYLLKLYPLLAVFILFIMQGLMEQHMLRVAYNVCYFFAFSNMDLEVTTLMLDRDNGLDKFRL